MACTAVSDVSKAVLIPYACNVVRLERRVEDLGRHELILASHCDTDTAAIECALLITTNSIPGNCCDGTD